MPSAVLAYNVPDPNQHMFPDNHGHSNNHTCHTTGTGFETCDCSADCCKVLCEAMPRLPACDTKLDGSGSPGGRRTLTFWLEPLFRLVCLSCTCKLPKLLYAKNSRSERLEAYSVGLHNAGNVHPVTNPLKVTPNYVDQGYCMTCSMNARISTADSKCFLGSPGG